MIDTSISPARTTTFGRLLFAIGLAGFALLQFTYGDFIPGRAPAWPESIPGRAIWAYLSGAMLIATSLAIVLERKAREALIVTSAMIFAWALLRHLPLVVANPHGGVLTKCGKALALFGGALAVAGSFPRREGSTSPSSRTRNTNRLFQLLGRWCLGAFMILGGTQHFLFSRLVVTLIPAWVPGPLFWTYVAGSALIAGGLGIIVPLTTKPAAVLSALMLLFWVIVLHVPRALAAASAQRQNEWTAVFEAMAFSGIAFVLAAHARDRDDS